MRTERNAKMFNFFKSLEKLSILSTLSVLLIGCHNPTEGRKDNMITNLYDPHWSAQDWIESSSSSPQQTIQGFYDAGIITDQNSEGEIPVIEVGQAFLDLSNRDKLRIIAFMDHVYGITAQNKDGIIYIEDRRFKGQIGVYTLDGLNMF